MKNARIDECSNNMKNNIIPFIIFAASFIYYSILSSKVYTWLFASGDSGDWLAASNWWIVPQPYGSPLYISLGHFLDLFGGDLVVKMTILLSCLPAAITIMLVYLIVKHLTQKTNLAIISSIILLGASIFLTQATVLEQYSLAVMFVTLAYYFYLKDRKKLVALSLGLGSANHILVIPIALLWLALERKQWKVWRKTLPVYIISGLLPYCLIIWLMVSDAPRLLAGGLSLQAINSYLGSTSVMGTLSILALPERALDFAALIIMSFGLAVIPVWLAFRKPWAAHTKLLIITIAFPIWYYFTCIDPTTWTFMAYACPFIAIATGIGLNKLSKLGNKRVIVAVASCAVMLVAYNSTFLNANILAAREPKAMNYYNEIQSMPDGSAVIIWRGGFEFMSLCYAMSEGKDLIPIFCTDWNYEDDALYQYYLEWVNSYYDLEGSNTQLLAINALDKGIPVYIISPLFEKWRKAFTVEDIDLVHFDILTGVDLDAVVHTEENRHSAE